MTNRAVLVVEDEILVTMFIEEVVHDFGLTSDVFTEGKAALEAFQAGRYVAAIIDLGLPDISGHQVVLALLDRCPALCIVLATGLDASETEAQFGHIDRLRILCKPFDGPELRQSLVSLGVLHA
jgi:DNA-binding response OmpR family regulator